MDVPRLFGIGSLVVVGNFVEVTQDQTLPVGLELRTSTARGNATVNVGESVTWVNTDGVPHTSTAALNHLWGDLMTSTDSYTYTFDTPGTYAYFCEMHPAMVGSINVVGE